MKIGGRVEFRERFTLWPDSVDISMAITNSPPLEPLPERAGNPETGFVLPIPPRPELTYTTTRVRLEPSDAVKSGWEFKSARLLTPKEEESGSYPEDVTFEISDLGPGYRLDLRGFKPGGLLFTGEGIPTLFVRGAEHEIVGNVKLGQAKFHGDSSYPLRFKFSRNGYVYLCGRGSVSIGDGPEVALGKQDTVQSWASRSSSPHGIVREAAANALGFLPKSDSVEQAATTALLRLSHDKLEAVRRNAAESMGRLKTASARSRLAEMGASDESEWVRKVAEWARRQLSE